MKSCTEIEPLVTALLDEEIAVTERDLVEHHLEQCSPCRARAERERTARSVIRARLPRVAPAAPEHLRQRCTSLAGRPAATPIRPARRPAAWLPTSIAAALVMMVSAAAGIALLSRLEVGLAAQLTADHLKCFALRPSEPTAENSQTIATRFQRSSGWNIAVPASEPSEDLELVTARRCLYGEGLMAHVMYDWRGEPLSLFVMPGTQRASHLFQIMGHEAVIWPDHDTTYALVGTAPAADMQRLAERVRAQLRERPTDSRR
jgi:anti-sigma factor RsiW